MPSENGWEPSWANQSQLVWKDIPGANARMQFLQGFPSIILCAFAADYNAYVEPLRDADCASYTPTNSVPTSNHLNGTAMDMRWESHPFRVRGTFTDAQMRTVRELLEFYEDTVFWAGDWNDPIDEMHWQMGYGTYQDQGHLRDFVARKIRADGYSTFRRGTAPQAGDPASVLARATGLSLAKATEILPAVRSGLKQSDCTNVKRIAMWLAQVGHESVSFQYTEEIDKTGRYAPYIGRTWIQITWDYNYRAFGQWCYERGLVRDPNVFILNPAKLADQEWAGIGAAWYWTVERPNINSMCDSGNFVGVTKAINGGTNGLADRQARYDRALALGDELLSLVLDSHHDTTIEELLMADTQYESWSIYKTPGEGAKLTLSDFIRAIDARAHEALVREAALAGDADSIDRVFRVAAGKGAYKDQFAINRAKAVIAELKKVNPEALAAYLASKGVA